MTSRFQPPPIIKAAERMAVEIENAVRRFARYHRYQIGSDLRARSQQVFINANNAWRERAEQAQVPPHKRLANAPAGRGLPIGNLSSQFFANVYLDALDQFAKHVLKAKRYLRYVDDFVLFHHDREQLTTWRDQIEAFLQDSLGLRLKAEQKLCRLTDGLDFLGYVIYPTHTLARRRVVGHLHTTLAEWEGKHVQGGQLRGTPADFRELSNRVASFAGHLHHASSHRLMRRVHARFPWLRSAARPRRFSHRAERRIHSIKWHQHKEQHV